MKRVKNLIKLTNLQAERLNENGLSVIWGMAGDCSCSCFYEACGGSTRAANRSANDAGDKVSPLPPLDNPNWGIVPPT